MLSPKRLGQAMRPQSRELLNEHILVRFVVVLDSFFQCSDWSMSSETELVQSFDVYRHTSFPSYPPSGVSHHSKRFRQEENVSPRGPPPWFTCQRTSANVEGAGKNQSRQSYTCLLTTNCHFPADYVICTFTVFQKYFYILAQRHFQILFEFRIQQVTFVSDGEAYSSSPHIPNKSFAFY